MRARLALAFMGIEYEHREVDLKHKPQALLDISPKGTVPVLVFPEGKILEESLDIVLWAMPRLPAEQQLEADSIIFVNDNDFKFNNHRYKYSERYINDNTQEFYRAECEKFIRVLEEKLMSHGFLISDSVSVADIAIFPLIRQFSMVDGAWFARSSYYNVQRWINEISMSHFFAKAMQKIAIWH